MKTATEVFFDPTIYGHRLVEPVQWYGRHISQILTGPLPEGFCIAAAQVIMRIVAFVALVCLSPLLIVAAPSALAGWAVKYYSQPIDESSNSEVHRINVVPVRVEESQERAGTPRNPPLPSTDMVPTGAEAIQESERSPATSSPRPSSFVPFTLEVMQAAHQKAEELKALYNGLKDLNGRDTQRLFSGIAEFRSEYERHRNTDLSIVDSMTKTFNIVDEIANNTSGMQIALRHWADFYRVQADDEGVIAQPKDGNCWLHTSILGLQHINHPNLGSDTYLTLRGKVVEWMQTHYETDETLRRFIADAFEAHKAVEANRMREQIESLSAAIAVGLVPLEETSQAMEALENYRNSILRLDSFAINDYFAHMKEVGSHGTHAELYAISRMFQVNVAIWRQLQGRLTKEYDEQIECPLAVHTVNAVLTQEGNHFNYRLP